jgi:uncharacterized protein DUF4389
MSTTPAPPTPPPTQQPGPPYPLQLIGFFDEPVSRWMWLVKWLLLIPHFIVLAFLWLGAFFATLAAFVVLLSNGRYPPGIYEYNLGVLRWTWRVQFYGYSALGTDRYPPFTLQDVPDYPARVDIAYPENVERGVQILVSRLIGIPHYIVAAILTSTGATTGWQEGNRDYRSGASIISILAVVGAIVLLVTSAYPKGLFDFLMGLNRYVFRAWAYAMCLTEVYPPWRFDQGPAEPPVLTA